MKKLLSLLLVAVMILGMAPVTAQSASAEAATPEFAKVSMTLGGILGVNFKVRSNNADMSDYNVRVTVGNDQTGQTISNSSVEEASGLYVYTASLPAHRMPESLKVELVDSDGNVVDSRDAFTVKSYLTALKQVDPSTADLASALENYGTYAAYYADPTGTAPAISAVEKVVQSDLESYKSIVTVSNSDLGPSAALYLDDACDLRISFSKDAWKDSYKFYFDGVEKSLSAVTAADGTQKVAYTHSSILPQNWGHLYNLKVVDTASNAVIFDCSYGVLTYARIQLGKAQEIQTGLNGLMKAMYLYHIQAKNYNVDLPDMLLSASSWADGTVESLTSDSITLKANSQIKGDYLKSLWEAGYTHLVFTYTSQSTSGQYVDGSGSDKYWDGLGTKSGTDIRIDLNEFHDGTQTTWYNLVFRDQNAGMTVSNVRAYKSPETLNWTKSNPNSYFAIEDGYYVLETHGSMYVLSPHDWLKKYCLDGTAVQNWLVYTDYIYQGDNYRSLLWGNSEKANDIIASNAAGGWTNLGMAGIGYTENQQFRLQLDVGGTARFKISDFVTEHHSDTVKLTYVDEETVLWSSGNRMPMYLASTQEYVAAGYKKLKVTVTGNPGGTLWYGPNTTTYGFDAFSSGEASFYVDLTEKGYQEEGKSLYISIVNDTAGFTFENFKVNVEPYVEGEVTGELYTVVHPAQSENYTFAGAYSVAEGADYTFTAAPKAENVLLTVKVNGEVVTPTSGTSYTVPAVDKDLYITVETRVLDVVQQMYLPSAWNNGGTTSAAADSIEVPANSQLTADYLKRLWDEGYTHLVFTYTSDNTAGSYIVGGGGTWSNYWQELGTLSGTDIRIDLNEFHSGDETTWYCIQFQAQSQSMTISNVRAYKSPETLQWTKRNSAGTAITNAYFAIEDGYYVLETRENRANVTSPAQWLNKYRVADDAGQRSWLVYTDYLSAGSNADSPYYGWDGKITHFFKTGTAAGWTLFNARNDQTPYNETITLGEATGFTFFLDHAGTARIKISDFVSNRNSDNAALKLEYVDDQTVIWSGESAYVLRYAPTQELKAAGYTHLRVTLTGTIPSGACFWYGNTTQNGVGPEKFTGGTYTFDEPLDDDYSAGQSFYMSVVGGSFADLKIHIEPIKICTVTAPTGDGFTFAGDAIASEGQPYTFTVTPKEGYKVTQVTVNGNTVTGVNNTYTVENVTGSLTVAVTAEPITYTVTKPTGDGFTVSGSDTASYGQPYTFTVEHPDYVVVTVKVNGNVVTGSGNTYTVENVTGNLVITVEATQLDVVQQLLLPSAWNNGGTISAAADSIDVPANSQLTADYLKRLWDEGYTHLVFTFYAQSATNYTHGGNWQQYWRNLTSGKEQDIRIDLNEFHDGDTWYSLNFSAGEMTVSNVRAYKSAETLQWTKSNTNIYFAIEDGYYILQGSTDQRVTAPAEWVSNHTNGYTADANWLIYLEQLEHSHSGDNHRFPVWGTTEARNGLSNYGDLETGWRFSSLGSLISTDKAFFLALSECGGTVKLKIFDTVARYNNGTMTYISDNSYTFTTTRNEQKYYLTTTDELIAQGYTHLKVTFQGDIGSNTIYHGNDVWDEDNGKYILGTETTEVDLSKMQGNPYTIQAVVAPGTSIDNMTVTIEPIVKQYAVTPPSGEGFTFEGAETAVHGQPYTFTVVPNTGLDATVTVNGAEIDTVGDNRYTVANVEGDLNITVTTATAVYTVNTPSGDGYTFAGDHTAAHGASYTFTVTPHDGYTVTVKVNDAELTPSGTTYTVSNVTEAPRITVIAQRNACVVTTPDVSMDFIFDGSETVLYGQDYTFTVEPFEDDTALTVTVNGSPVTGENNTYTVENVTEEITIAVVATPFTPASVILDADNWSASGTAGDGTLTVPANSQLKVSALQTLWKKGYTHLVFTVNTTSGGDNAFMHGGEWDRYWRGITAGTNQTLRIDLNEFHDGDTWYSLNFSNGGMTVSDVKAYKSAETLNWTKTGAGKPSNVYFAIEDGYYVLETNSAQGVNSPAEWLNKIRTEENTQRTFFFNTDYINQGSNDRSVLFGWDGEATSPLCDISELGQWKSCTILNEHPTAGTNKTLFGDATSFMFSMGTTGTARIKMSDIVTNRSDSWNEGFTYTQVDDTSFKFTTNLDVQKFRLLSTQDLITQGYTHLKVTFQGNPGENVIWYGNDWNGVVAGLSKDQLTEANNYTQTVEIDLSQMAGHPFTVQAQISDSLTTQVTIEPIGKADIPVKLVSGTGYSLEGAEYAQAGQPYSFKLPTVGNVTLNTVTVNNQVITPVGGVYTVPAEAVKDRLIIRVTSLTIKNGIVTPDESIYGATANLLQTELAAAGKTMTVYNKNASNVTWENSILLGTQTSKEASAAAESYTVQGNGTNILVDGSCDRAVTYGTADLLRSLGYEFYTADVTVRPASVSLNYHISLADSADFAGRSYMSDDTSYNEDSLTKQGFTAFSKQNNGLVANFDNFGGISYYDFGGGVHNFDKFFASDASALQYGKIVSTGVGSNTGYAPCLTNGVTYNVGGADTTLSYAIAHMKEAILANPDAYYFTFCQNDGPTWYCNCASCVASASSYNRSGTLVNFINKMLEALAADPDLAGRDYRIVTFAYDFTAVAPKNVSSLNSKLMVWYAHWHNAHYSINSSSQNYAPVVNEETRDYKTNLQAWADLTEDQNLALWLYDANFNNYLALFPSINTIAQNIKDAQALGVSNILVQSGYEGEGNWQAELKAYIWSKLLWDSSLDVTALQNDFLKAYFGEAAYSSVQSFMNTYSSAIKSGAASSGFAVTSGNGYYCHYKNISSSTYSKALDYAQAAVSAAQTEEQKARANALLATVYGSVLAAWDEYKSWSGLLGGDYNSSFKTDFGSSVSTCQQYLRDAIAAAGITHPAEGTTDIDGWISAVTNRGY